LGVAENIEKEENRQRQVELKQYQKGQAENRKKIAEEEYVREIRTAATTNAMLD
jgi:hypothetical protein